MEILQSHQQSLVRMFLTHQTTILMVNNQLDLARVFCTRLLYLEQGQLLTNQTASEINWINLKKQLTESETQATQEWI